MSQQPTLQTSRLTLRRFELDDAAEVQRLAGDEAVAATTLLIPHPYRDGLAESWIRTHPADFDIGAGETYAVVEGSGALAGAITLRLEPAHRRGELGYWIGRPYWGRGYATEAGCALLRRAFESLGLERVYAHHMDHNAPSGRVLEKLGMRPEGRLRRHILKWGVFRDQIVYGILRDEWLAAG